jgi:hypothetical protein
MIWSHRIRRRLVPLLRDSIVRLAQHAPIKMGSGLLSKDFSHKNSMWIEEPFTPVGVTNLNAMP